MSNNFEEEALSLCESLCNIGAFNNIDEAARYAKWYLKHCNTDEARERAHVEIQQRIFLNHNASPRNGIH